MPPAVIRSSRAPAVVRAACAGRSDAVRLITIDGPAGAGKSTLAAALLRELDGATVVAMDDLYDGWGGLDEQLFENVRRWVLDPVLSGRGPRPPVYDWGRGRFGPPIRHDRSDLVILEGVGAGHPVTAAAGPLSIWVQHDPRTALDRAKRRDPNIAEEQWDRWARDQARYFDLHDPASRADIVVDPALD